MKNKTLLYAVLNCGKLHSAWIDNESVSRYIEYSGWRRTIKEAKEHKIIYMQGDIRELENKIVEKKGIIKEIEAINEN